MNPQGPSWKVLLGKAWWTKAESWPRLVPREPEHLRGRGGSQESKEEASVIDIARGHSSFNLGVVKITRLNFSLRCWNPHSCRTGLAPAERGEASSLGDRRPGLLQAGSILASVSLRPIAIGQTCPPASKLCPWSSSSLLELRGPR